MSLVHHTLRAFGGLAIAICVTAAIPGALAAQRSETQATTAGSAKVVKVTVSGTKKLSSETLARASGLQQGDMASREDIQAAADRLGALGWFNKVQYKFNTTAKGVEIEFTLEDAPTIPVSFDNFPWFTEQELAEAIRGEVGLFDGTAPEGGDAIDRIKEALQKLVKTHGVPGEVESTLLAAPGESGMEQQFRLNGPLVRLGALEFSDELARTDKHIADRLSDIVGRPYSRYALELFDYENVRPIYLSKGYLRVRFGAPDVKFSGSPHLRLPDTVVVRLPIERGRAYRWGSITWSGNAAFDAASLDKMTGLAAGEPADGNKIQTAWDHVETEYGRSGYIEAKIDPQPEWTEATATISYRVAVAEGIQYRVGRIIVTGLSLAGERQLLAAWGLPRGEIFNKKYFDDFVATGVRKVFENSAVHFETVGHLLQPHPETKLVDVLFDFQ